MKTTNLIFLVLFLNCAGTKPTTITPTPNPVPVPKPKEDTVIIIKHDTVIKIHTDTVSVFHADTVQIISTDTLIKYNSVVSYRDTSNTFLWITLTPGSYDNSLELQTQVDKIDFNTGFTHIEAHLPYGYFTFRHPIIFHNFKNGVYFPFTIDFYGEGTAASADGSGTIFDFRNISQSFCIGIQGAKGAKLHGITFIQSWNPTYTNMYDFYNGLGMGPGMQRNTNYSPSCAIAIDPFGPHVPSDGGFQGTDAYGNNLSTYYRGYSNGSTGIQIYDCKFIGTWIGIILSPNGQTANAESMHFYNLNFDISNANPIVGCQDQEKGNEIGPGIIDWGATSIFIQIGTYGAHSPGQYIIHGINIAGPVKWFIYDQDNGYYPTFCYDIFAETLGSIGLFTSRMGSSFSHFQIDFANYIDASFSYLPNQVNGSGILYRDGDMRMYGTFNPISVNNLNGFNSFDNVGFDVLPYYNTNYPVGHMTFRDCKIGGWQTDSPTGTLISIDSTAPGFAPLYQINDTLVGLYHQATVQCVGNELSRIKVGDILVAFNPQGISQGIAGIISSIGQNNFILKYIPSQIGGGNKYGLNLWKQKL